MEIGPMVTVIIIIIIYTFLFLFGGGGVKRRQTGVFSVVTNEVREITIKLKTRPTIQLNGMALLLQEILGLATLIHITKVKV